MCDKLSELARAIYNGQCIENRNELCMSVEAMNMSNSWHELYGCQWNKQGTPDGYYGNTVISRNDMFRMGRIPQKSTVLTGFFGKFTDLIPLRIDKYMDPDSFIICIISIIILVSVSLLDLNDCKTYAKAHNIDKKYCSKN